MLEIKTIVNSAFELELFDMAVNEAITDGWELVRRDVLISGGDRGPLLYAELERQTEPEEEPEDDLTAEWELVRNPVTPFRCSKCGHSSEDAPKTCPGCGRRMEGVV